MGSGADSRFGRSETHRLSGTQGMIVSTAAGMLSLFHYCGDTPFQKHLKGESTHSAQNSRLQFLALGKSRQQEIDAAGHIIVLIQSREP